MKKFTNICDKFKKTSIFEKFGETGLCENLVIVTLGIQKYSVVEKFIIQF